MLVWFGLMFSLSFPSGAGGSLTCKSLLGFAALALISPASATSVSFNDQSLWAGALGAAPITVFHFDGATETNGLAANAGSIAPSYSSQGVDFLPFEGTSIYPQILRGQDFQINTPGRDGLLANTSSPNSTPSGRAIIFNFNTPIRAVGAFSNNIDRGTLEAYDSQGDLIGSALIGYDGWGQFGGLVSDTTIAQVKLINTYNSDLTWGIYDLQFSGGTTRSASVPDGGSTAALLGFSLVAGGYFRRKQLR